MPDYKFLFWEVIYLAEDLRNYIEEHSLSEKIKKSIESLKYKAKERSNLLEMTAEQWLLSKGYQKWSDDTWSINGEEADVEAALQQYIDEIKTK